MTPNQNRKILENLIFTLLEYDTISVLFKWDISSDNTKLEITVTNTTGAKNVIRKIILMFDIQGTDLYCRIYPKTQILLSLGCIKVPLHLDDTSKIDYTSIEQISQITSSSIINYLRMD